MLGRAPGPGNSCLVRACCGQLARGGIGSFLLTSAAQGGKVSRESRALPPEAWVSRSCGQLASAAWCSDMAQVCTWPHMQGYAWPGTLLETTGHTHSSRQQCRRRGQGGQVGGYRTTSARPHASYLGGNENMSIQTQSCWGAGTQILKQGLSAQGAGRWKARGSELTGLEGRGRGAAGGGDTSKETRTSVFSSGREKGRAGRVRPVETTASQEEAVIANMFAQAWSSVSSGPGRGCLSL